MDKKSILGSLGDVEINKDNSSASLPEDKYARIEEGIQKEKLIELQLKNKATLGKIDNDDQDRLMRKEYASNFYALTCMYLVAVCLIIVGSGIFTNSFYLSDGVLIAILTTTTANILALIYIVANYLFPKVK